MNLSENKIKKTVPIQKNRPKKIVRLPGLFYHPSFVTLNEKDEVLSYLKTIYPIWEWRYSKNNPPPPEDQQRRLLRPVYWLKNWQFACLDYYHPPKGIENRCMHAEEYPRILKEIIHKTESITKMHFKKSEIPPKWQLNTCLINFYGSTINENGTRVDTARVGDHKDFELGPVVSLSFGERAFFQFVEGNTRLKTNVAYEQWLDDCSLMIFGGPNYKDKYFHRVQRVENKLKKPFDLNIENFETRRINFTFRYVPTEHIKNYVDFPIQVKEDIDPYIEELSKQNTFFQNLKK